MSVDVTTEDGRSSCFSNAGWRHLIAFAAAHGCRPADPDATAFAAAEMAALADAIDRALGGKTAADVGVELTTLLVVPMTGPPLFRDDPIVIQDATLAHWRECAQLARRGAATITY